MVFTVCRLRVGFQANAATSPQPSVVASTAILVMASDLFFFTPFVRRVKCGWNLTDQVVLGLDRALLDIAATFESRVLADPRLS